MIQLKVKCRSIGSSNDGYNAVLSDDKGKVNLYIYKQDIPFTLDEEYEVVIND